MQVAKRSAKLMSLLIVFLTENYEHGIIPCEVCGTTIPSYSKTFLINKSWVCIDCILDRINNYISEDKPIFSPISS
jgi:hypothetical protein